jgi:hypothetical protein
MSPRAAGMADDADIARWDAAFERAATTRLAAFVASHVVVGRPIASG